MPDWAVSRRLGGIWRSVGGFKFQIAVLPQLGGKTEFTGGFWAVLDIWAGFGRYLGGFFLNEIRTFSFTDENGWLQWFTVLNAFIF